MIKNAGNSGALAQKENPQQISTQTTRSIRWILCFIRRPSEKYVRNMAAKIK
jgi:hypothetical protein